jgi:hypothetical protein
LNERIKQRKVILHHAHANLCSESKFAFF